MGSWGGVFHVQTTWQDVTIYPWKPNFALSITACILRELGRHYACWCFVLLHSHAIYRHDIYGLVQERRNSSALAMELRLSCTKPSISTMRQAKNPTFLRMDSITILYRMNTTGGGPLMSVDWAEISRDQYHLCYCFRSLRNNTISQYWLYSIIWLYRTSSCCSSVWVSSPLTFVKWISRNINTHPLTHGLWFLVI